MPVRAGKWSRENPPMVRRAEWYVRTRRPAGGPGTIVRMTDVWRLDATGQAELVQCGEASPAELVEAAIARIERVNPRINAVVTPMYDEARRRAADASALAGPFAGVPMLLKDASIEVEGAPYFIGTRVLGDIGWRSRRTTEVARRRSRQLAE